MIDKLLELEADKQAEIDELIEDMAEDYRELMDSLLRDVAERDEHIFGRFGADMGLTIDDLGTVPVLDRDLEWQAAMQALLAASEIQAFVEIYGFALIEIAETAGLKIDKTAGKMARDELITAARQGIGKERFKAARDRRLSRREEQNRERGEQISLAGSVSR